MSKSSGFGHLESVSRHFAFNLKPNAQINQQNGKQTGHIQTLQRNYSFIILYLHGNTEQTKLPTFQNSLVQHW